MEEISKYFNGHQVRIAFVNGEPWFVAKDICSVLGLNNVSHAIAPLKPQHKTTITLSDTGSNYKTNALAISEPGLYKLIFKSKKKEADLLEDWVSEEILPTVRKTGGYVANEDAFIQTYLKDVDESTKELFKTSLIAIREKNERIAQLEPKEQFTDAVSGSRSSILIRDLAKLLRQNGYPTGEKRLFEELREKGFLIRSGADRNSPTQKAIELGVLEIKERPVTLPNGLVEIKKTPVCTGKGQVYFINKFLEKKRSV